MSRHALPVKWDGHPVVWGEWEPVSGIIICGGVSKRGWRGCKQCHTRVLPRMISGQVCDFTAHSLVLFRCMTCGYTTVMEITDTDENDGWHEWILDESDYGDEGSTYCQQGELIL
jgi:hypothetical protein